LDVLGLKQYVGECRVCYLDEERRMHEIPLNWTDLAPQDPLATLAGVKSCFRAMDLLELAHLIEGLER
jgi:hypothetical protein